MVLRVETLFFDGERRVEHEIDGIAQNLVDRHLGAPNGQPRAVRQAARERAGRVEQRAGGHDVIDQPDPFRLVRGDQIARHQELLGPRRTDQPRPDDGTPVARHDAHAHVRIADLGVVRGIDDVRKQGQRGAQTGGRAVDRGDDRLFDFEQVDDDLARLGEQGVQLRRGHVLKPLDVPARAKGAPLAGQDHRLGVRVLRNVGEDLRQFRVQSGVDRIQRLRAVERDGQHLGVALHAQTFVPAVIHAGSLLYLPLPFVMNGRDRGLGRPRRAAHYWRGRGNDQGKRVCGFSSAGKDCATSAGYSSRNCRTTRCWTAHPKRSPRPRWKRTY